MTSFNIERSAYISSDMSTGMHETRRYSYHCDIAAWSRKTLACSTDIEHQIAENEAALPGRDKEYIKINCALVSYKFTLFSV